MSRYELVNDVTQCVVWGTVLILGCVIYLWF